MHRASIVCYLGEAVGPPPPPLLGELQEWLGQRCHQLSTCSTDEVAGEGNWRPAKLLAEWSAKKAAATYIHHPTTTEFRKINIFRALTSLS